MSVGLRDDLPELPRYTFGAMSLGRDLAKLDHDIKIARAAMDARLWFHASQEHGRGGGTFMVLRHAFDEARSQVPPCILKIRCDNHKLLRFEVEDACRRLGLDRVDIAQLCMGSHERREFVYDFLEKGPIWATCCELKEKALVGNFVMEVFATFSDDAIQAVQSDLFDAYILYYNLLDRQATNKLTDLLQTKQCPLLSLRTFAAGTLDADKAAQRRTNRPEDPLPARRVEIEPVFEQSGCDSMLEFAMRFVLSVPGMQTTIGGTSSMEHLQAYIATADHFTPLDPTIVDRVLDLHRKWMG